jgi:hypothetical protein
LGAREGGFDGDQGDGVHDLYFVGWLVVSQIDFFWD